MNLTFYLFHVITASCLTSNAGALVTEYRSGFTVKREASMCHTDATSVLSINPYRRIRIKLMCLSTVYLHFSLFLRKAYSYRILGILQMYYFYNNRICFLEHRAQ